MKMILLLVLGYLLAGCQTTQPPQALTPHSLCLIDPQSGFCWISRAKGLGIKLDQMQGFYALSSDDLKNIVTRLNWCQSHPENPEALDAPKAAPTETFTNTLRHIEK